jgi:hypothetical protein
MKYDIIKELYVEYQSILWNECRRVVWDEVRRGGVGQVGGNEFLA